MLALIVAMRSLGIETFITMHQGFWGLKIVWVYKRRAFGRGTSGYNVF
jgi:hypothetical protein